jgi:FixJ family two-component response regulator
MAVAQVLVVDDEPSILTTLKTALRLEGYAVDVAGGVQLAEERANKKSYDLILLDVALPDGDGVDLLARLRESGNDAVVIMMSGHATVDAAVRATKLGAIDFLEKGAEQGHLLASIRRALQSDVMTHDAREHVAALRARFSRLTPREREVLEQVVGGRMNKQIAARLGINERTVKLHRTSMGRMST